MESHRQKIKAAALFILTLALGFGLTTDALRPKSGLRKPAEFLPGPWVVSPLDPGPNLPTVGRSLFDQIIQNENDLYPFEKLIAKIAAFSPGKPPARTFFPHGRSLQRDSVIPGKDFTHPRQVIGFMQDPEKTDHTAFQIKDRIFVGFSAAAQSVEIISYNDEMGRFEFQEIRDYRDGGKKQLVYSNRAICHQCHQNQAPIFSEQPWFETEANPAIADSLGIPRQNTTQALIDKGKENSSLISSVQKAWTDLCPDNACRGWLLRKAFSIRLRDMPIDGNPIPAEFIKRYPDGLLVPNPRIIRRNPVVFDYERDKKGTRYSKTDPAVLRHYIPHEFAADTPRAPLKTWTADDTNFLSKKIAWDFFTMADFEWITKALNVTDTYAELDKLIQKWVTENSSVLSNKPFQRRAVLLAISEATHTALPFDPHPPNVTLPFEESPENTSIQISDSKQPLARLLGKYCSSCHRGEIDPKQPKIGTSRPLFLGNFTADVTDDVLEKRVRGCIERMYYRVAQYNIDSSEQDANPMPRESELVAIGVDASTWRLDRIEILKFFEKIIDEKNTAHETDETIATLRATHRADSLPPCQVSTQ